MRYVAEEMARLTAGLFSHVKGEICDYNIITNFTYDIIFIIIL